jgi:hypothetical protein
VGEFYSEIKVDRDLVGTALRRANERRRKKGKKPLGRMTTITIRDMKMGEIAGGSFYVRSSNLQPVPELSGGWSSGARQRLEDRLREGRCEKGRVLYGVLETINNDPMTIAALTYHYEHSGEIEITSIEATGELNDYRAKIEQTLTIAAERIAIKTSNGQKGRLLWKTSRDGASRIKEKLGFRELTREANNRVVLVRDADVESLKQARSVTH